MKKLTPFVFISLPVLLLSACSSTTTVKQLQDDFNKHKYSSYVSANLKSQPTAVKTVSFDNQKLKTVTRQLASRKKHSGKRISGVINQNDLYLPARGLQQQVAVLNTTKKMENWLSSHSNLEAVLTILLRNNLDIKSSQEQAKSSLSKYDQVAYLDDTLAQYASFIKDIKLTGSTQKHKKATQAAFPFPSLQALKSSIIDQSVEASRLQLKQTVQDVITKARIAYHELQLSRQQDLLTKQSIKLLSSLKSQLKSSYSTNSGELSAILQVDIEIENNHNMLQVSKDKQRAQQSRLNALLNLSADFSLGRLESLNALPLKQNAKTLITKAQRNRIEIARLKADLVKMKRIIELSEKRFYPDFDAGFSRLKGGKFSNKPTLRKNDFFAKNDAYLAETKQKYRALQAKIKALKTKTGDDIQQALSKYLEQKRSYKLYKNKVLPKVRSTLDIAKNTYETGESSFIDIIEAEEMILDYQLKSLQALKEMNINIAKIERFMGSRR